MAPSSSGHAGQAPGRSKAKAPAIPKRVPPRFTLHPLQSICSDSPSPAILLSFDSIPHKYLFGLPDTVSRNFTQCQISRKVEQAFVPRVDGDGTVGGLSGIIFNALGSTKTLTLHGPPTLLDYLVSMRFFVKKKGIDLRVNTVSSFDDWSEFATNNTPQLVHSDPALKMYAFAIAPTPPSTLNPLPSSRKRRRPNSSSDEEEGKKEETQDRWMSQSIREENEVEFKRHLLNLQFPGESTLGTLQTAPNFVPPYIFKPMPAPSTAALKTTLLYVGIGPESRGKFNPKRAMELGIKDKRMYSKLTEGETVKNDEGIDVRWEQVMDGKLASEVRLSSLLFTTGPFANPSFPVGKAFALVDCPSVDYIEELTKVDVQYFLTERYESEIFGKSEEGHPKLKVVVHSLGPGVFEDERYLEWMGKLGSDVDHVIASKDYIPDKLQFVKAAFLQLRLSKLDRTIFPLPKYSLNPTKRLPSSLPELRIRPLIPHELIHVGHSPSPSQTAPPSVSSGAMKLSYPTFDFLVPSEEADEAASRLGAVKATPGSEAHSGQAREAHRKKEVWKTFVRMAEEAKEEIYRKNTSGATREDRGGEGGLWDNVVVTTLGTGSAMPSSYRTVSSTLVQVPGYGNVLLDVGEGTLGQLSRRFGQELDDILQDLKFIFISHMHADHHAGLYRVLWKRLQMKSSSVSVNPLYILGPWNIGLYLKELEQIFPLGLTSLANFVPLDAKTFDQDTASLKIALGLKTIRPVSVIHRGKCFGVVLEHVKGWKLVFSGDTRPCPALIEAGKEADLLIHEATIEDDVPIDASMMNVDEQDHDASRKPTYLELAASKGHSTFGEATEVAVQMKARHCLLTHFSARYPKLPPLSPPSASSSSDEPKFAVAFDLMSIRMGNWWKLAHFRASMATLFSELEPDEVEVVSVEDAGGKEPPIPADEKRKTLPPSQKQKPAKKKKLQTKEQLLIPSQGTGLTTQPSGFA
ncbi:hypothetical protein BT69DRAFT_1347937 [Atractiella rhizophila]|nr:hypothetical protein BT69DRAFT_1347937 [Atractiella rhizophila]